MRAALTDLTAKEEALAAKTKQVAELEEQVERLGDFETKLKAVEGEKTSLSQKSEALEAKVEALEKEIASVGLVRRLQANGSAQDILSRALSTVVISQCRRPEKPTLHRNKRRRRLETSARVPAHHPRNVGGECGVEGEAPECAGGSCSAQGGELLERDHERVLISRKSNFWRRRAKWARRARSQALWYVALRGHWSC